MVEPGNETKEDVCASTMICIASYYYEKQGLHGKVASSYTPATVIECGINDIPPAIMSLIPRTGC